MKTLKDFGMEVMKIREAANMLEVKGQSNASLVVFIVEKCNAIIKAINEIVAERQNGKGGEVDNEQNSGVSEQD